MGLAFNQILHNSCRFVRKLRTSTSARPTCTYLQRGEPEPQHQARVPAP